MKIYGINKKTLVVESIETPSGEFLVKETPELAFRATEGEAFKVLADEVEKRINETDAALKSLYSLKLAIDDRLEELGEITRPGLFDTEENYGGDVENGVELI